MNFKLVRYGKWKEFEITLSEEQRCFLEDYGFFKDKECFGSYGIYLQAIKIN